MLKRNEKNDFVVRELESSIQLNRKEIERLNMHLIDRSREIDELRMRLTEEQRKHAGSEMLSEENYKLKLLLEEKLRESDLMRTRYSF